MCPRCHGLGRETCGPPLLCRPGPLSPGSGLPPRAGQARENSPRPARPARRSRKRRGRGPEGRPRGHPPTIPPPPRTLKSLPLRSTPRTNGSTPVASMVAQLSGRQGGRRAAGSRGLGQRRPRPFNPRAPPPGRGLCGKGGAAAPGALGLAQPRLLASSGTGEACGSPGLPLEASTTSALLSRRRGWAPGSVAWAAVAWEAGRDPGEIAVPTSGAQAACG